MSNIVYRMSSLCKLLFFLVACLVTVLNINERFFTNQVSQSVSQSVSQYRIPAGDGDPEDCRAVWAGVPGVFLNIRQAWTRYQKVEVVRPKVWDRSLLWSAEDREWYNPLGLDLQQQVNWRYTCWSILLSPDLVHLSQTFGMEVNSIFLMSSLDPGSLQTSRVDCRFQQ